MKPMHALPAARSGAHGFTLTELLVVMAIVGILLAIGTPTFRSVTNSNRIASEINGLLGDMQFARLEAIKQGVPVTVCVSSNATSCTGTNSWRNGWIVFSDSNGNGTVDTGEAVLRVQKPFTSSDTFTASNSVSLVTWNREGFATGITNGSLFTLRDVTANTTWTRCLSMTLIGAMSTQVYGSTVNGFTCS